MKSLVDLFENAKTFGSLIQVSSILTARLPQIEQVCREVAWHTGELASRTAAKFLPVVEQTKILNGRYECVVTNPPYMNSKYYVDLLKVSVDEHDKEAKADLYARFIRRNAVFARLNGFVGMITIQNWMFLPSFEKVRKSLLRHQTIDTFVHNGRGVFGSDHGTCSFAFRNCSLPSYRGTFRRLFDRQGSVATNEELDQRFFEVRSFVPSNLDFAKIPGSPLSYWASSCVYAAFAGAKMANAVVSEGYVMTGKNARYIRCHWEVDATAIGITSKWRAHSRGGDYRKWYGNVCEVVDWSPAARQHYRDDPVGRILNPSYWDIEGVCWSEITISKPSFRLLMSYEIANKKSPTIYPKSGTDMVPLLAYLNSSVANLLLSILNPTIGCGPGDILRLPLHFPNHTSELARKVSEACIALARLDWNSSETSWEFRNPPRPSAQVI